MAVSQRSRLVYFTGICISQYLVSFVCTIQGVMLSEFIAFYDLVSYRQGLMATFQSIGAFLSICLVMLLSHRMKKRTLLLVSMGCMLVAVTIISTLPPFPLLLCAYFIHGLCVGASGVVSSALAADIFEGDGFYMGLSHAAFGCGGLTGPLIMNGLLNLGVDWQAIIIGAAILAFVGFCFMSWETAYSAKRLPERKHAGDEIVTLRSVFKFLAGKRNILLLLAMFAYSASQNGTANWIKRYITITMGSANMGAVMLAVYWVGSSLSRAFTPKIKADRMWILFSGCLLLAILNETLTHTENTAAALIIVLLSALASGATVPMIYSEACDRFSENTLTASSVTALFLFAGCMSMAPITASLMDHHMHYGMRFLALMGLISAVFLVSDKAISMRKKAKNS